MSFCRTNNSPAVIFEASQISHFADMIYRMILPCNRVQIPAGRQSLTVNILDSCTVPTGQSADLESGRAFLFVQELKALIGLRPTGKIR